VIYALLCLSCARESLLALSVLLGVVFVGLANCCR
jgi:hypothetical protein